MATLKDIRPGERAVVTVCAGTSAICQRLCELGFVPGARLRVVRYAPLGDPMEVEVDRFHLALRRAEAARVEVERA